ncbi:hypothetical protein N6H05_23850 [Sphingobium sp. WTD-1]|uniref:hypothetical protein n=1 Tax=Sphingobium sp. WTD-1 TaxID=2979467 RepID=UPI0024DEB209|nr:hypothetical protein [Sphingobium sp. WTD-1]WIA56014.1 hypothetical protein N6H05_23850 [Sphingobium sp. WTD-1]
MSFYEEMADLAVECLTEFGAPATLSRETVTFDKKTNRRTAVVVDPVSTLAVVDDMEVLDENTGRDVIRTIATMLHKPEVNDKLTMGDRTWIIGKVTTVQPTNLPIIHFAEVENA